MTIGSTAWSGLSITPGSGAVSFSGGEFTLDGTGVPQDDFTLAELTGGAPLPVAAGDVITIQAGADSSARIQSLSFKAVPEPTSYFVWMLILSLVSAVVPRRLAYAPGYCKPSQQL